MSDFKEQLQFSSDTYTTTMSGFEELANKSVEGMAEGMNESIANVYKNVNLLDLIKRCVRLRNIEDIFVITPYQEEERNPANINPCEEFALKDFFRKIKKNKIRIIWTKGIETELSKTKRIEIEIEWIEAKSFEDRKKEKIKVRVLVKDIEESEKNTMEERVKEEHDLCPTM